MTTPVTDMIRDLLSQGVSWDIALRAATKIEQTLAENTTSRGSSEDQRRYERERKALWRERKAALSPGTSHPDIYLSESPKTQIQSKKDRTPTQSVPDVPGQPQRDDWPADYVDRFWQAYPPQRRTEKAKVAKKLALVRKSGKVTWVNLMAALQRYAGCDDVTRGFAKGPVVWINGGCWEDEVRAAPRQKPQRKMSALTRIALGLEGEDHDKQANGYDGPTLDLRPVPDPG